MAAEIRVGHAGPQRHHAEARYDIHGRQPDAAHAEGPRRRKGEQRGSRDGDADAVVAGRRRIQIPDEEEEDQRSRHGDHEQYREDERHIEGASECNAVLALDRAKVRGRLDRRRAMVALAIRHTLAALQRRGMTKLRVVAHRSVDVEHAPFADERVVADRHRAHMDEVRLRAIAEQHRAPADDGVVTDRHKVGTDRGVPAAQDHVAADPGAHQAQIGVVERCTDKGSRRRCAHQGLDGPEAEICKAPDRNRLRLEAADQQPFRRDGNRGQRNKHSCAEGDAACIELHRAVGGRRPLITGFEDQEYEQQIGRVEANLQGAARDVRQGRRNVEGFRLR